MKSVLGLVPHRAVRTVDHLIGAASYTGTFLAGMLDAPVAKAAPKKAARRRKVSA